MLGYLLIALGGAVGSVARYWLASTVANRLAATFPWGTMAVNVSGCFLIGLLAALSANQARAALPGAGRALLMIGFCGGFTTFSSFSLETLNLVRAGEWQPALLNVSFSLVFCLAAVWLGFAAMAAWQR